MKIIWINQIRKIMAKSKDVKVVDKKKPKQEHEKKDKKKYL
jgi:hypothetical protein